ncbi:MAG: hypothetical protein V2A79_02170 [Planctomycetota bacterium]
MVNRGGQAAVLLAAVLVGVAGCGMVGGVPGGGTLADTGLVSDVAAKATDIAGQVGGADGFGGALMDGYWEHAPAHMGFWGEGNLATSNGVVTVRLSNQSNQDATVHLSYLASYLGLEEQTRDVDVGAGEEVTVELPCPEIIGVGSFDAPGAIGCHLLTGETVDNVMAVPGFLGMDYACGGTYELLLAPDVDDLDGDGDTEELILLSEGMQMHMLDGGPMGHMHRGAAGGMMGGSGGAEGGFGGRMGGN